ncbi:hypothetical protein Q763_01310 [Flavobacterium beibuense F44-8]|uniref:Uncharacterized protein n=1 Tax=Flavobacterium beibuense F44-8 TaxID=1406840 RepID=A0A0A2LYI2_9FLAO|nr:hypothetical protein [Flavobacterium beibuense]KGO84411.1 hypothetical protein Q763_01310 [Flavobacterium beibuense F44-8]
MHNDKINFAGIRDYILENELTDSVAIVLHPDSFDSLAMDYISQHGFMERPFEILGITILEDTTGSISRNKIETAEI